MKASLVITDVTRMQEGRVCIAGYTRQGKCVRPVMPPPGIHERTLYSQGRVMVFPFAVVEYDLLQQVPQPPHTEDCRYDPTSVWCFIQITGVYTFPDYLNGRTFADLAPGPDGQVKWQST
jgi:hypothetical protein